MKTVRAYTYNKFRYLDIDGDGGPEFVIEEIKYEKDNMVGKIGFNRAIYDIIMKGNIEDPVYVIKSANGKTAEEIGKIVKRYLEDVEDTDIVFTHVDTLIRSMPKDIDESRVLMSNVEKELESIGFKRVLVNTNVLNVVSTLYIYNNIMGKEIIEVLTKRNVFRDIWK